MSIWYNLLQVEIDLKKLTRNYLFFKKRALNPIPVIKADAYGHGLVPVALSFARAGAKAFAVGSVEEAVVLRLAPFEGEIISLLGPVFPRDYELILEEQIIPFVYNFEQLLRLQELAAREKKQVALALKYDTGMARLGFKPEDSEKILEIIRASQWLKPIYLASHLASADVLESSFVREQKNIFEGVAEFWQKQGFSLQKTVANSAGILAYPELHYEVQRPGIGLYGSNPFYGTRLESLGEGLESGMSVKAPILHLHTLKKGQSVSYGQTFVAPRDLTVAVVGVGYADNYSRRLSNRGWVCIKDKRCPVLGRVCMQMIVVDISNVPGVEPGEWAYLLGGPGRNKILPEELAKWWQTITYEVFCLLGQNPRTYV